MSGVEEQIQTLQTENARLRLQLQRARIQTRAVLQAVAEFGGHELVNQANYHFGRASQDVIDAVVDELYPRRHSAQKGPIR